MVKFLIVGIQRSGTTYIRRCLDSHSMIHCHGEVFQRRYRDQFGYYDYISGSLIRRFGHVLFRRAVVSRYLHFLSSMSAESFVGFKLMRSQVRRVPYEFPMLLDLAKSSDIKVIQIVRRNVLKTHLSRLSTQMSGRYHAKSDVKVEKLMVDASRIIDDLDKIRAENEWWQTALYGTGFIVVEYENFVINKVGESRRILDYIGVKRFEDLSSSNRKINPDDISQLVVNYPELVAALRGTRYAYCLES